jgi:hypothetical protein
MSSGDNAEDLFPQDLVAAAAPPFHSPQQPDPWHKPRKHWIRKVQWGELVDGLIGDIQLHDRPFRYLTLPGKYLLDIRQLHGICSARGVQLRFLGFDTSRKASTDVNVSADEVWRLPFVHKDSELLGDRVEDVANVQAIAHERVKNFGDFDAINLDFCDSVGGREAGASDTALEAILRLISLQSGLRAAPWLLFITTRSDRPAVKRSVMVKLLQVLEENLSRNIRFRARATRGPLPSEAAIRAEFNAESGMGDEEFIKAFGIGFSKWLLSISLTAWKVQQQVSACYRVSSNASVPDMLSLAFRFERQPLRITDRVGLVRSRKNEPVPRPATEEELAIGFLDSHRAVVDVDRLLFDDQQLREQMIAENAELMSLARFDCDFMIRWGRENCWHPS